MKLTKKSRLALLCIFLSFSLCGCWDSRDIQNSNIGISVFTDYKDNEYVLYVETAKTKGAANQSDEPSADKSILFGKGNNTQEARDSLDRESDYQVYLNATKILVFGKSFSQKGILEYLNRMRGTRAYRKNTCVFTTDVDDIKELTELKPENNLYLGTSVEETMKSLYNNGTDVTISVQDVLAHIAANNPSYVIPIITKSEKQPLIDGYSIFDNSASIGVIPHEEKNGLIYLLSKKAFAVYPIENNGNMMYFNARLTDKKISPSYNNGKISFDVTLNITGDIYYSENFKKISNDTKNDMFEKLKNKVKDDVINEINRSQYQYGCDYLEFYKYFKAKYYSDYKSLDWKAEYKKAIINVNVNMIYKDTGLQNIVN